MLAGQQLFKEIAKRRKARKDKTNGKFDKKKLNYKTSEDKPEFKFPKLRPSELERLKTGIRSNTKRDRLKDYALFFIIFLILFASFYYFMN